MITCINCGATTHKGLEAVQRNGNNLKCRACLYEWTTEDEQRNQVYIQTVLHRKPLKPLTAEELADQSPVPETSPDGIQVPEALEGMTVDQLKTLAEQQHIDLRGARVKADILMVLADSGVVLPGSETQTED